jgi:2-polyprenyl-6-hydroxyphenyl methylase/3-demethylubiquinone-9 3-methyltransferase
LHLPQDRNRIFELGCGNGAVAEVLTRHGYQLTGVDVSIQGVEQAQRRHPHLLLQLGSAYDRLADTYGRFPVVISLEVVEHLYDPRAFARNLFNLVESRGTAIVSTPYHGYWKNLAMALTGCMDHHFTALWDHGHIKFWSMATLRQLLQEAGFHSVTFRRVGRVPALAKSMIAIATKS